MPGRAPNGSAASNSWSATRPASGNSGSTAVTTCAATHGRKSASAMIEESKSAENAMRHRHVLWSLAALAVLGAGVVAFLVSCLPPRITEEQFEKVEVGMTLEQVEGVLGHPPGHYLPSFKYLEIFNRSITLDEIAVLKGCPPFGWI